MDATNWERLVIGTVLDDPESIAEVTDLTPSDFSKQHQEVWKAIVTLGSRKAITWNTVVETLRDAGTLSDAGNGEIFGEDYIQSMMLSADLSSLSEAASVVRNASTKRRLAELGLLIAKDAKNGKAADEIIDAYMAQMGKMRLRTVVEPQPIGSMLLEFDNRQMKIMQGDTSFFWVPPLPSLHNKIPHLNNVDFAVIVGETGAGKSHASRFLGLESALRGDTVLHLSFENSREESLTWALARIAKVNHFHIMDPRKQTGQEKAEVERAKGILAKTPYFVEEIGIATATDIKNIVMRFSVSHPELKLIVIDGMYLVQSSGRSNDTFDTIARFTQSVRSLAQQVKATVIGTTQYRKKEKGASSDRELDDIYYAGEKQARVIMAIKKQSMTPGVAQRFPENILPTGNLRAEKDYLVQVMNFDVMKFTNGRVGLCEDTAWYKPYNLFRSLAEDWKVEDINGGAKLPARRLSQTFNPRPKAER